MRLPIHSYHPTTTANHHPHTDAPPPEPNLLMQQAPTTRSTYILRSPTPPDLNPNPEPAFVCTICWQPQPFPALPKLLGASSRIVCYACWKAVLDLSICWVCGECIVRGDEVVSLGWCFWHRGCFGCLVCGRGLGLDGYECESKLDGDGHGEGKGNGDVVVKEKDKEKEGKWGEWDGLDEGRGGKRKIGVELERIPLCGACDTEAGDGDDGEILEKGLLTVSRSDGGLSRDRLDMLTREDDDATETGRWTSFRRYKGLRGLERDLLKYINGSSGTHHRYSDSILDEDYDARRSLIRYAAKMGTSEDGTADDEKDHYHSDKEVTAIKPQCEDVYLSVFNPTGEAAFKASKTKKLPDWMSLLPSKVEERREKARTSLLSECATTQEDSDSEMSSNSSTPRNLTRVSTAIWSPLNPPETTSKSPTITSTESSRPSTAYTDIVNKARRHPITEVISTSLGSAVPPLPQKPATRARQRAPPTGKPSTIIPKDPKACLLDATATLSKHEREFSDQEDQQEEPSARRRKTVGDSLSPHLPPSSCHSTEFIDKYQAHVTNPAKEQLLVNKSEQILEKIKRQRMKGKHNMVRGPKEMGDDVSGGSRGGDEDGEESGVNPKRDQLKKELRDLFQESL